MGNEFVPRAGQLYNYNPTTLSKTQDKINAGFFAKYDLSDEHEFIQALDSLKMFTITNCLFRNFGDLRAVPCYNALLSYNNMN